MKTYQYPNNNAATVVEFDKSELLKIHFALCAQPRETLSSFYNRQTIKPDVICNGGLFNMEDGVTMFEYRTDNNSISTTVKYKIGMGITTTGELKYGNINEGNFVDFISGYPPLLNNGERVVTDIGSELNYSARRTALGYNKDKIFLVVVEGRGVNFTGLTNIMLGLKCTHAINLDGGGSSKILVNGKSITSENYNRAVDNVICFYRKSQITGTETTAATKTLYTVQIGAFKDKANCLALVNKIKALPDAIGAGYKNAYCKEINGFYKCQVGAFGNKNNAQRVVDDLKTKGYNAFITERK